jgi:hypothetical protein
MLSSQQAARCHRTYLILDDRVRRSGDYTTNERDLVEYINFLWDHISVAIADNDPTNLVAMNYGLTFSPPS